MNSSKMKKEYESVEDTKDLRIPVQSEEAFEHGINFRCKYIGTEEIPRPNSRVEIVASMRRIRYEHKYRNIKKRKVFIEISADGIKVTLRKKKKKNFSLDDSSLFIMQYPINRVFYVSHDSQDLKILSYIARGEDGIFRCSVFKALKKSQAMHMVRTIGQAFEVCHKINQDREKPTDKDGSDALDESSKETLSTENKKDSEQRAESPDETDIDEVEESDIDSPFVNGKETVELQRPQSILVTDLDTVQKLPPPLIPLHQTPQLLVNGDISGQKYGAFTLQQLQQLYHQQLLHQMQQADSAKNEVSRLREQLNSEIESRNKAQTQVTKLLAQNRVLLTNMQKLMMQLEEKYVKETGSNTPSWRLSDVSQNPVMFNQSNQDSTQGFGSSNMDFDSQIFDNSNATNRRDTLTFDDIANRNFVSNIQKSDSSSTLNDNNNDCTIGSSNVNPFIPKSDIQDVYIPTYDNNANRKLDNKSVIPKFTETVT